MRVNRISAPAFQTITNISFPWPVATALPQGIPLFILNKGIQPIIRLCLIFDSGFWYEQQPAVAYFTAKMLQQGTQKKSAYEIARYIDHYGAELSIEAQVDHCIIEITTLTQHFNKMLMLLAEILFEPVFPEKQLSLLKHLKIQAIKVENEKSDRIAYRHYKAALLGADHPYGRYFTIEDIMPITVEPLHNYYQQQLLKGCKIFLSGQITDDNVQMLQHYLQPLTHQPSTPCNHHLPSQSPTKIQLHKENNLQCSINIGKLLFTKNHPDFLPMRFITKLLGGYFGSRLMCNIREDKGYTYGIHAGIIPLKHASYFIISTDTIKEFGQHTCEEIYKEIKLLQTQLVSLEELKKVKNYILGNFLSTVSDPFSMMERFKEAYLYGLDEDFYKNWYNTIMHISASQIVALTNKYLSVESLTEVTVS